MALTPDQLKLLRAELGSTEPPSDFDLAALYELRGGLVGVARHVWSSRLADLINTPASFTVVGDYSQTTSSNIAAIQRRLLELSGLPDDSDELPPGDSIAMLRVVPIVRVGQDR